MERAGSRALGATGSPGAGFTNEPVEEHTAPRVINEPAGNPLLQPANPAEQYRLQAKEDSRRFGLVAPILLYIDVQLASAAPSVLVTHQVASRSTCPGKPPPLLTNLLTGKISALLKV